MVFHCVSRAKGCAFNSQETHTDKTMYRLNALWIKASAKCVNVNAFLFCPEDIFIIIINVENSCSASYFCGFFLLCNCVITLKYLLFTFVQFNASLLHKSIYFITIILITIYIFLYYILNVLKYKYILLNNKMTEPKLLNINVVLNISIYLSVNFDSFWATKHKCSVSHPTSPFSIPAVCFGSSRHICLEIYNQTFIAFQNGFPLFVLQQSAETWEDWEWWPTYLYSEPRLDIRR